MKSKLYLLIFSVVTVTFFACKTASKMYEKGNYDEAVELAAKKLQKDPDDSKLRNIIQSSYRYALEDHQVNIRNNEQSSHELKFERLYHDYASLQRMYDAIYKVPEVFRLINPIDYSAQVMEYAEKAAHVRFDRGLALLDGYNKKSAQAAYREFQVADRLKPGDSEITLKLNESYEYAVTNVVILPLEESYGYRFSGYNSSSQRIDEQLLRELKFNAGNEFVRFYSDFDARNREIRVDEVVDMRLSNVNIGRFFDRRSTRRVSKEVVIKEIVYRPDSVVKVYGKVYADITTTHRSMNSDALLQVSVRSADGAFLWNDNFGGNHSWSTDFASFTGDERALSEADRQLVNRKAEQPPHEEEILRYMLEEITSNAVYRIRNYFIR